MDLNEEQEALLNEAVRIATALTATEERAELLKNERVTSMRKLHDAGVSWAAIGRTFNVTPQAAMYATGHAKRQARKSVKKDD